jgi:hypothetical protein
MKIECVEFAVPSRLVHVFIASSIFPSSGSYSSFFEHFFFCVFVTFDGSDSSISVQSVSRSNGSPASVTAKPVILRVIESKVKHSWCHSRPSDPILIAVQFIYDILANFTLRNRAGLWNHHAAYVRPSFQVLKQLTDFREFSYGHYSIGRHPSIAVLSFLQSVVNGAQLPRRPGRNQGVFSSAFCPDLGMKLASCN